MNLQTTVATITHLPQNYFSNNLIFDDGDNFSTHIKVMKLQYRNIGLWLNYYFLGYQELYFDIINSDAKYYKPLGERSYNIYKFLLEIKILSDILQNENIHQIWYLIEREIFEKTIENFGLYGTPLLRGKRKNYETTLKHERQISDVEKISLLGKKHTHSAIDLIISEAVTIAKIKGNCEFREKYRTFLRNLTRCDYLMYKSEVNIVYIKAGKLFLSGDGKRSK